MNVEPIYAEIGRQLMYWRHTHGRSQEEVASLLGLTRASIANIETGRQRIMLHHLIAIAVIIDTEPGALLTKAMDNVVRDPGHPTRQPKGKE